MPTIEWNKRWGVDLEEFSVRRKDRQYGVQWGDPAAKGIIYWMKRMVGKVPGDLSKVITYYIKPYITNDTVVLEIGSGGGRWTQYLLQARELILVDLNADFFPYLKQRFQHVASKLRFYQTKGYELDGVEADCVDFIFSFGTFVHIDPEGIDMYLAQIKRVMKPGALGVIHYADRSKKFFRPKRRIRFGFSDMNAEKMEGLLAKHSLHLREHNVTLLNHSNIVVFQKGEDHAQNQSI